MDTSLNAASTGDALCLGVLGAPAFSGTGAEDASELLRQPMRLALLVFLAGSLPRGFRRRDELVALLWPTSDAQHARNSLRQSLHVLRQRLPDGTVLTRGSDEVALSAQHLRLDTELLEHHLDQGREEEGLTLYRGELLPGSLVPDCPEFAFWLDAERERLRRRAVRGAMVLAHRCESDGDAVRAAHWANVALARAPYDEDVLHDVVELLHVLGDRAGAVRIHAVAVKRFRSQLGITLEPVGEYSRKNARVLVPPQGLVLAGRGDSEKDGLGATSRAAAAPTRARVVPPFARQLYLEARQFSAQRSPATIGRAIDAYKGALRLAPEYAEAHAGLAFALTQATVYISYPGIDTWPRIKTHASRAVRLSPSLGEAHAMLAQATLCNDYDWTLAGQMYRHAIAIDPVSDIARQAYAHYFLAASGRTDEALDLLNHTRDLMHNAATGASTLFAMSCVFGRQFERGRVEAEAVIDMHPEFSQAYWAHGLALEGLGEAKAAIRSFETGVALTNGSSLMLSQLGRACARGGFQERAREILSELDGRDECAGPAAYYTAEILAALGDADAAIERLYAAYRQRNPLMIFAGVMFGLDPLRGHRRFKDLLMRLGIRRHDRRGNDDAPATFQ